MTRGADEIGRRRPRGVLGVGLACLNSAVAGRAEHRATARDYSPQVLRRESFIAGGGLGWRLSALRTPRQRPPPWKIVVITGAPSWAEYWAPTMAALPPDREMVVVDRPGYAGSEPLACVGDLATQAAALEPLLARAPGQRLLLVGQSYGAAIAALMAARRPRRVAALALLSSYLGEPGPTARFLVDLGGRMLGAIPRDLRNAILEIRGQPAQLPKLAGALARLRAPVHILHGARDDFAPIAAARALADHPALAGGARFRELPGVGHFLNDGPAAEVLACLEPCLAQPATRRPWTPGWRPAWTRLQALAPAMNG